MRFRHFLVISLLIPFLSFALNKAESHLILKTVYIKKKHSSQLINDWEKQDPSKLCSSTDMLKKAFQEMDEAIGQCVQTRSALATLAHKSKKSWIKDNDRKFKHEMHDLSKRLSHAQKKYHDFLAIGDAKELILKSYQKADLAVKMNQAPLQKGLNNVDEVVARLSETANLYDEACEGFKKALTLINPLPLEKDKTFLQKNIEDFQKEVLRFKKEAAEWPQNVEKQKASLISKVENLQKEAVLFEEKQLFHLCYETQKQIWSILDKLIHCTQDSQKELFQKEKENIEKKIALFEKKADENRLFERVSILSFEEFQNREDLRRKLFFLKKPACFSESCLSNLNTRQISSVIPLDGQRQVNENGFILSCDQFYRFLIHTKTKNANLTVKVFEKEKCIEEETLCLPTPNSLFWERYLTRDGLVFIPQTPLKERYGLDLRISFELDPQNEYCLFLTQKISSPTYSFSFSFNDEPLYTCHYQEPPPWQLNELCKPNNLKPELFFSKTNSDPLEWNFIDSRPTEIDTREFAILDQFVEEHKKDPLLLTQYVYQEIALVDPFQKNENHILQPSAIHRNPYRTFIEKQGSPWEQCRLLVYLLRKAGYEANYVFGAPMAIPKKAFETMTLSTLSEDQKEALVEFPCVLFFDGKKHFTLFPWLKETQLQEGYDLYNFLPEAYASADRWVQQYLKSDEHILKHIGPDGDDTVSVLFIRFVQDELQKQGICLEDVGIHFHPVKRQFSSWADCPRAILNGKYSTYQYLGDKPNLFAKVCVDIFSVENPQKKLKSIQIPLVTLCSDAFPIFFTSESDGQFCLHAGEENQTLVLDANDLHLNIQVKYSVPIGSSTFSSEETLTIAKGTFAALCFHFSGETPKLTSEYYKKFTEEKEETKRILSLLAFVGASFFEKCGRSEKILSDLHKVPPTTGLIFGLAKLSPDFSSANFDLKLPQVDMIRIPAPSLVEENQKKAHSLRQCLVLQNVDHSSNEHQILREVFDANAISAVKLLQLAHQDQIKKGKDHEGFLILSSTSFETADKSPKEAQTAYFSHLSDLDLRKIKEGSLT